MIALTLASPRRFVPNDDDPPTITVLTTEEGRFETWTPWAKRELLKGCVHVDPSFEQFRWATPFDAGSGVVELRLTEPARRRVACDATIERKGGGALVVDFIGWLGEPLPARGLVEFDFDGGVAHLPVGFVDEVFEVPIPLGLLTRRGFRVRSVAAVVERGKSMSVWSRDAQCQVPRGLVMGRAVGLQATGRYVIGVTSVLDSKINSSDVIGVGPDGSVCVGPWRLCTAPGRDGAFYVPDVPFGEVEVRLWLVPDGGGRAPINVCERKFTTTAEQRTVSVLLNGLPELGARR